MTDTKAPGTRQALDPESESWSRLPWRTFEQHVYRIQKRIFRAEQRGNQRAVHKLQKLLLKSRSARLLAIRRVTRDDQGKQTADIEGVASVKPQQRDEMAEALHPTRARHCKPAPLRKRDLPGQRPLGIPVIRDRAHQYLVKQALEPQWEARFEPHSYGFRPGRSCHDAIGAIFNAISSQPKYVLEADLQGCFDHINHEALLHKLQSYPALKRSIRAWLKAGLVANGVFEETPGGTSRGAIASLLANIAFHGMETALAAAYTRREGRPDVVRYAGKIVVFHPTEQGIARAKTVLEAWIQGIGLEMKPSTTRITHTLHPYQGKAGFDFLGWTVRQFPAGKTPRGKPPGCKTIIRPAKEAEKRHMAEVGRIVRENRSASQGHLIEVLNPVIGGWTNSYRTMAAAETFQRCQARLFRQLWAWGKRRHPGKGKHWIVSKYWHVQAGQRWQFSDKRSQLWTHDRAHIQRYASLRGHVSPYDGDLLFWSQRLSYHPMLGMTRAALLQQQEGKCRWCGLRFRDGDLIAIDHQMPARQGGGATLRNALALHRHCYDERHTQCVCGTADKGQVVEEPDALKGARPVLQTSKKGDSLA